MLRMVLVLMLRQGVYTWFISMPFYLNASLYHLASFSSSYRKHEHSKKFEYSEYVHEIEHGVLTPLVFSSSGGMALEATVFYKRSAELGILKREESYSIFTGWKRMTTSLTL